MVQTTEGALTQVQSIMQRMRELGVQGSNGTLSSDDRKAISSELGQLKSEVDRISTVTDFNGLKLLSGSNSTAAVNGTFAVTGSAAGSVTTNTTGVINTQISAALSVTVNSDSSGNVQSLTVSTGGTSSTINVSGTGSSNLINLGDGVQFFFTGTVANAQTMTITATAGTQAAAAAQQATLQIGANNTTSERLAMSVSTTGSGYVGNGSSVTALSGSNLYAATNLADSITQVQNMLTNSVGGDVAGAFRALSDASSQALKDVSAIRGVLGATQNRLENTIANLGVAQENLSASESRIRDVDMAKEMVNYTKTQILQQAGTSILAQANQSSQGVLALLR
jgi:flagellin